MDFSGSFQIAKPAVDVYRFLVEPNSLSSCIPGVKQLNVESPESYTLVVRVGVAFIKGDMTMKINLVEKDEGKHAKIVGNGTGMGGTIGLEATMDLTESDGKTTLNWKAIANVGGKIASLGQRVMNHEAQKLIKQIFENMEKNLA
ncbi:MAG: carbon monoxide dehydrogenase subunit G [Thermoplasmataceae archaeon]